MALCRHDFGNQENPMSYTLFMLFKNVRKRDVALCGNCRDALGLAESDLIKGAKRYILAQLADWTPEAETVLVF
jgi:uncharacterized protein involved in oxidation of intracellular sulfur